MSDRAEDLRRRIMGYREDQFSIGGIDFEIDLAGPRRRSTPDLFMALKAWDHVDVYIDRMAHISVQNILEFGIHQGGSTLLYYQLFEPEKLVAIELLPEVVALRTALDHHNLTSRVRTYFDHDQADRDILPTLLDREFSEPIDVVIDDASHFYDQTRASFEIAFPRVRPGGLYFIEDWGWAHWNVEPFQNPDNHWRRHGEPAMSNLIFEISMMCATHPELISRVEIFQSLAVVHRGPDDVPQPFDIEQSYLTQDRPFVRL